MILRKSIVLLAAVMGIAFHIQGCQSGGVGDPCIPEDEYQQSFPGFSATEVNLESRSFQCETRVCLVYRFRGRVSCPLGQKFLADGTFDEKGSPGGKCHVPGSKDDLKVAVNAQCSARTAEKTVYCSCRCDGADPNGKYCECPDGFACTKLEDLDLGAAVARGSSQLAGSYCVRNTDSAPPDPDCRTPEKKPCVVGSKDCGGIKANPLVLASSGHAAEDANAVYEHRRPQRPLGSSSGRFCVCRPLRSEDPSGPARSPSRDRLL